MSQIDTANWQRMDYVHYYTNVWHAPVIPIAESKKALVKWAPYQSRLPTDDELKAWFVDGQPWGLAIVCGAVAGNLFSIDIDTDALYKELFQAGAFPQGACIYKSMRGYHVIMRADIIPFCIKEHHPLLAPDFWELGISGDRTLSNVPNTPKREWIELYDDPVLVPYEAWLKKYLNYSREMEEHYGAEIKMKCPYHDDEQASLFINQEKGVFHCFGCNAKGTLAQLLTDSRQQNFKLPDDVWARIRQNLSVPAIRLSDKVEEEHIEVIIDQLLEGGENATVIISGDLGVGKTTLGLSIAIPLGQGKMVLGKLRAPKAKRVAYINFEQRGMSIHQQAKAMTTTLGETENLIILDGRKVRLWDKDSMERLWNTLIIEKAEVLIMDSIQSLVRDYNSKEEADEVREFASKVVDELHCAVIFLHHIASGEDAGAGAGRAKGTLGKMLAAYCATKLLYTGLSDKIEDKYYGRVQGTTRAWDIVDWCVAYEGITKTANIIDWQDLDKETKKGLGRPSTIDLLDQGLILARRMGRTKSQCADDMDIDIRSIQYYLGGEQYPSAESEQKINDWITQLKSIILDDAHLDQNKDEQAQNRCVSDASPMRPDAPHEGDQLQSEERPMPKPSPLRGGGGGVSLIVSKIKNIEGTELHKAGIAKSVSEGGAPNCAKCTLKGCVRVEGYGEAASGIMYVGEAPGEEEEKQGMPFVGRAGKFLDELLASIGLDRGQGYTTNVCLCRPPVKSKKQTDPTPTNVKCCKPRLLADIARIRPHTIYLLGDTAVSALLPAYSLARYHGKKVVVEGITYIIMYHPSAGLHNPYYRHILLSDVEQLPKYPPVSEIDGNYSIAELSPEDFKEDLVTIDTETVGLYGRLLGGAICLQPASAAYYVGDKLTACLKDCPEWQRFLFHNAKYDLHILKANGYDWHGKGLDDTQLLAYCLGYENTGLKVLETQELNLDHPDYEDIKGTLDSLPTKQLARYCCQDADATRRLWDYLVSVADEREMRLYNDIEKPLLPVLVDMECKGVRVDLDYVREWAAKLEVQRTDLEKQLGDEYGLTPKQLNSPKQLGDWLHEQGVDLPKTDKSEQYATGKEILAGLKDKHPAILTLINYRQTGKLLITYAQAYLRLADNSGYLHSRYHQGKVVTGRLSSYDPNLQNLPHTFDARRPFIASEGNKLVSMDFSQIDTRAMAVITGNKALMEAYQNRDMDIHNWLADKLFGDHEDKHRYVVKSANYLSMYGGSARGLHTYLNAPMGQFDVWEMGVPPSLKECEEIIEAYYTQLAGLREWQQGIKKWVREHYYVEDYYGRRRYIYKVASSKREIRAEGEREAINFPIAGTASEVFKMATSRAGVIWTPAINIHDELVFDLPVVQLDELIPKLQGAMQGIAFPVPLVVKYKVGDNLGELL